jgi:putative SOS response-associated peptidase YedK
VLNWIRGGDIICARYTVFTEDEIIEMRAIIDEVSRKFGDGAVKMGEIYPTNIAPILTLEDNRLAPVPAAWGFPKWKGPGVVFNARRESALEKPMFSKPLLTRRCVIPSTGFYEWTLEDNLEPQLSLLPSDNTTKGKGTKAKLLFRRPDDQMLYMAGMINTFGGEDAFVILTTDANASMTPFHDRMPVILSAAEREDWIHSEAFMKKVLARECPELVWTRAS